MKIPLGETKALKQTNRLGNIFSLVLNQIPIILLASGLLSFEWTPKLVQKFLMIEEGQILLKPTFFDYFQTLIFFLVVLTGISATIALIQLEVKKKFDSKFYIFGLVFGEFLGILVAIDRFNSARFCGNTTFPELLIAKLFTILFWATIGFFVGLSLFLFFEKIHRFLVRHYWFL